MQLTFQDNDSEAEDDEDPSDFTKDGLQTERATAATNVVSGTVAVNAFHGKSKDIAKNVRRTNSKVVQNKSLTAILDRTVADVIPCANEHRSHYRRILEILITDMNLNCRVREKNRGSCVAFKIVAAAVPPDMSSTPVPLRSQLLFSPGMLEVNMYRL